MLRAADHGKARTAALDGRPFVELPVVLRRRGTRTYATRPTKYDDDQILDRFTTVPDRGECQISPLPA